MPLYITIRRTETSTLRGEYNPWENRFFITEIKDGNEIAKALQSYLSKLDDDLPRDIYSVTAVSDEVNFTSESSPWLKYVRIYGNSMDGLSSDRNEFRLSLDLGDMFWDGTFQSFAIGEAAFIL